MCSSRRALFKECPVSCRYVRSLETATEWVDTVKLPRYPGWPRTPPSSLSIRDLEEAAVSLQVLSVRGQMRTYCAIPQSTHTQTHTHRRGHIYLGHSKGELGLQNKYSWGSSAWHRANESQVPGAQTPPKEIQKKGLRRSHIRIRIARLTCPPLGVLDRIGKTASRPTSLELVDRFIDGVVDDRPRQVLYRESV